MPLFGSSSRSTNQTQTQADSDNLAADSGAVVVKSGGGNVWLSDPGALEAIGETLSLGRGITDGAFHAVENQSRDLTDFASRSLTFARGAAEDSRRTLGDAFDFGGASLNVARGAIEDNRRSFGDALSFARSVTQDALRTFTKQTDSANNLAQTSASLAQQQFAQSGALAKQAITTSKDDGTEIILSGIKYGAVALALVLILPKMVKK